jgi:hypothetical protein
VPQQSCCYASFSPYGGAGQSLRSFLLSPALLLVSFSLVHSHLLTLEIRYCTKHKKKKKKRAKIINEKFQSIKSKEKKNSTKAGAPWGPSRVENIFLSASMDQFFSLFFLRIKKREKNSTERTSSLSSVTDDALKRKSTGRMNTF